MSLNNKDQLKILVSHSGRQYVHQLIKGLGKAGHQVSFVTSFAYKKNKFPFTVSKILPKAIREKVQKELRKRSFEGIPDRLITQFPWFELLREVSDKVFSDKFAEKMQFYRDRIHDQWAATKVKSNQHCDLVIGYEECCLELFKKAKSKGITTVLDLAQIHYKEITEISEKFPVFSEIYQDKKLRSRINAVKEAELKLADYIICLSQFAKDSLIKHGIAANKIFIAHLGFDPTKFQKKVKYDLDGPLKLVFAGTITKRKGIDLLLQLKEKLGDLIELKFIGPMADGKELFLKYKGKYTWNEYLEQVEMNKVFQNSDLFVFPSYLDSWAMVVLEAMACGLPVVVSDTTGAKDAVTSGGGFIISNGNIELLTEKVEFFIKNRQLLSEIGKSATAVANNYTWNNYYLEIKNIIKSIAH